ncbi:uncharacterized protein BYT42DRAFT_543082 [Radiomyces spectabilis]|uniref:uncharacterized protein n=1 Tax=Radiomyces spectabilis TaxID=64574 RepID=UPI00221E6359|nr:uncharacterized protein BYT42DRAFT_543082 [Radiomyces spectabilis]KAI8391550.1 hypothetical protein BYT42DRAFT_543082 [Radiomyces spectabilis]
MKTELFALRDHIFERGLQSGIGSDIIVTVPAWDKEYKLHRLILDQIPYFQVLFEGSFQETSSDKITLQFDNPYITAEAFQLVLNCVYGRKQLDITAANVLEVLSLCSYFQLHNPGDVCIKYITEHIRSTNVLDYLKYAEDNSPYGEDRIYGAGLTYLCREAFDMEDSALTTLSPKWLQKIVESDTFWVPSEYDRYQFVHRILKLWFSEKQTMTEVEIAHQRGFNISQGSVYGVDEWNTCYSFRMECTRSVGRSCSLYMDAREDIKVWMKLVVSQSDTNTWFDLFQGKPIILREDKYTKGISDFKVTSFITQNKPPNRDDSGEIYFRVSMLLGLM